MAKRLSTIVDNGCYHSVNENGLHDGVRSVFMPHYCPVSNDNATLRRSGPLGGRRLASCRTPGEKASADTTGRVKALLAFDAKALKSPTSGEKAS